MDADGTGQAQVTDNGAFHGYLSRGPTVSGLAFTSDRGCDYALFPTNLDGSGETQLTFNNSSDSQPTWGLIDECFSPSPCS